MSNDAAIEAEIQAKGKTAPRITPEHVEAQIVGCDFYRVTSVLTLCVLTLRNGFTVTGESACASPENYDQQIGEKIARGNAVQKIWGLEGYLLRSQLAGHVVKVAA